MSRPIAGAGSRRSSHFPNQSWADGFRQTLVGAERIDKVAGLQLGPSSAAARLSGHASRRRAIVPAGPSPTPLHAFRPERDRHGRDARPTSPCDRLRRRRRSARDGVRPAQHAIAPRAAAGRRSSRYAVEQHVDSAAATLTADANQPSMGRADPIRAKMLGLSGESGGWRRRRRDPARPRESTSAILVPDLVRESTLGRPAPSPSPPCMQRPGALGQTQGVRKETVGRRRRPRSWSHPGSTDIVTSSVTKGGGATLRCSRRFVRRTGPAIW